MKKKTVAKNLNLNEELNLQKILAMEQLNIANKYTRYIYMYMKKMLVLFQVSY